jgi:hypothetical protein
MAKRIAAKSYDEAISWLRAHDFVLLPAPGTATRVFLKKYNCSAAIEMTSDNRVRIFAYPGNLVGGEIAKLVDRGYQKFLKTSKLEIPASAEHLQNLHRFTEELKEAIGATSLYNESLGSVSESYQYDRVQDRDLPGGERPRRPWEKKSKPA